MIRACTTLAACCLGTVVLAASTPDLAGRDPFVPPSGTDHVAATPLERLDIDRLRLVGLVFAPAERALLEDQTGVAYLATVGTPIGPRGGRVVRLEPGRLRIHEPAADDDIILELGNSGGGTP